MNRVRLLIQLKEHFGEASNGSIFMPVERAFPDVEFIGNKIIERVIQVRTVQQLGVSGVTLGENLQRLVEDAICGFVLADLIPVAELLEEMKGRKG